MDDLLKLLFVGGAIDMADAHAEKQRAMINEQSRAADAVEASERKNASRAKLKQKRSDEKLIKEKWLQAQRLALASIEGNLRSGSRSKDDLLKAFKTAHFFELYSGNPFEQMNWFDRCNEFQALLRDSISEYKSEFTKKLKVNRKSENELKTEIQLYGKIKRKEPNEQLNNFYHSHLRELKSNLRRLVNEREKKKRQEEAKKKAAEQRAIDVKKAAEQRAIDVKEAAEQRAIDVKEAAEQRARDQKLRAKEALRVETRKRQKERDEWNPTLARYEEQDLKNYDRLTQVDFIARKIVAVLAAADGEVTTKEQEWINELWGHGTLDQILLLASSVKGDELNQQIKEFCKSADVKALAYLWFVSNKAQELIESDGEVESETEAFNQIKDSILSGKNKKKLLKAAEKNAGEINSSNSNFIYMDFLLRRVATFIMASDGYLSSKEQNWIDEFWGVGSSSQILAFSKQGDFSTLLKDIRIFCEECDEEYCRWLWVVTHQFEELISADGHTHDLELSTLWMVQDAICGLSFYEYTP